MKVTVKIDSQLFEVEIENLYTRPIVAVVDGQRFEVWPEISAAAGPAPAPLEPAREQPASPSPGPVSGAGSASRPTLIDRSTKAVHAPIPGVIVAIAVKPGDTVTVGQEVCVLEAMKMKNVIRAPRAGTIAAVRVTLSQHVKHNAVLVEFADETPSAQ